MGKQTISAKIWPSAIILTLGISLVSCGKEEKKTEPDKVHLVKTMMIGQVQADLMRSFPGKVEASQKVKMSFRVAGRLIELPIRKGLDVKQGYLVARLDPKPFDDQVAEAEAKYKLAKVEYERYAQLLPGGHVTRSQHDVKQAELGVAQANLDSAKRDLSYSYLYAPFDGTITDKYVENHQFVNVDEAIVSLQDATSVDVRVSVPENVMAHIEKYTRDKAYAVFEAVPDKRFKIKYKEHTAEADPETQTYDVIVTMPAPKEVTILPGMTATIYANLSTNEVRTNYFSVPVGAVFSDEQDRRYVWLIDPKTQTIKKQPVTVSSFTSDKIKITQGLKPGDQIVTAGVHYLRTGDKVRAMQSKMDAKGN